MRFHTGSHFIDIRHEFTAQSDGIGLTGFLFILRVVLGEGTACREQDKHTGKKQSMAHRQSPLARFPNPESLFKNGLGGMSPFPRVEVKAESEGSKHQTFWRGGISIHLSQFGSRTGSDICGKDARSGASPKIAPVMPKVLPQAGLRQ
ncbi:hypothetical protein [Beijerinckia mobilis]|uniref:hypothetical protein n=1 Tax=Beijerinckia mobilis TaxID=231434 RepID=UPI0012ECAD0E|nr:hypothetical protein [Beijerinckia mobilis]